ncbi:hypothetical protein EVAR_20145_1 [Eumeta japonica]|uniref:Uncharacterized protein n=1 Tax=Eumeta variegata TaxID=151549 RepID=A0A4C1V405_EUMVA|nr:hypothetical protein EVAR_20145_1 [Eumeta japonica]
MSFPGFTTGTIQFLQRTLNHTVACTGDASPSVQRELHTIYGGSTLGYGKVGKLLCRCRRDTLHPRSILAGFQANYLSHNPYATLNDILTLQGHHEDWEDRVMLAYYVFYNSHFALCITFT